MKGGGIHDPADQKPTPDEIIRQTEKTAGTGFDIQKSRDPTNRIPAYSLRQGSRYTSFNSSLIFSILASSAASVTSNSSTEASGAFTPK